MWNELENRKYTNGDPPVEDLPPSAAQRCTDDDILQEKKKTCQLA